MKYLIILLITFNLFAASQEFINSTNSIKVNDVLSVLLSKYYKELTPVFDDQWENDPRSMYDRLKEPKPKFEELQAKLELYKASLFEQEDLRIAEVARVEDLKNRWNAIFDCPYIVRRLYPTVNNPLKKFNDMLSKDKATQAEALMKAIETEAAVRDAELLAEQTKAEERENEIKDLKENVINLINNSDKPLWEKKLLIRLVKELRK